MAADVCAALSIANSRDAVTRLDEDEKGVATIDTLGGRQEMATVNESGLYSLILGSRKPEAKRFKKWVTSEVLPAIRKTGSYNGPVTDSEDKGDTYCKHPWWRAGTSHCQRVGALRPDLQEPQAGGRAIQGIDGEP